MSTTRWPIRLGSRSRPFLGLIFGATPETAWAEVDSEGLRASFGKYRFQAPLENIVSWRIEGPFRWITAIGIRTSLRHRDMSFAGSPHGGVRMDFRVPIPYGPLRVPAFYVGADDLDGFAAALAALGVPGEDVRQR
ncbi:MAG: hypothetical protein ABI598_02760 [Chloroflexota bacterium]